MKTKYLISPENYLILLVVSCVIAVVCLRFLKSSVLLAMAMIIITLIIIASVLMEIERHTLKRRYAGQKYRPEMKTSLIRGYSPEQIIAQQTEENDPDLVTIVSEERNNGENATIFVFDYDNGTFKGLKAVIYDEGCCFTSKDWTNPDPEEWYDHSIKVEGVLFNGLPRIKNLL